MSAGQTIRLTNDVNRTRASRWCQTAPHGAVVNIREATRTNEQNDKMHAMLSDIARAKPGGRVLTTDQWKCLFMDATAKETKNAAFTSRWEPSLDGEGVVNTGYRSSRLTKAEMGDLISFMDAWGTEHGVEWSEPQKKRSMTQAKESEGAE